MTFFLVIFFYLFIYLLFAFSVLPRSIGGIIGYDKKLARTYAFDKRKRAYIASDDGINWIAVNEMEVNDTVARKTFYRSQPVPAFTTEDIDMLETKTGRWEGNFIFLRIFRLSQNINYKQNI